MKNIYLIGVACIYLMMACHNNTSTKSHNHDDNHDNLAENSAHNHYNDAPTTAGANSNDYKNVSPTAEANSNDYKNAPTTAGANSNDYNDASPTSTATHTHDKNVSPSSAANHTHNNGTSDDHSDHDHSHEGHDHDHSTHDHSHEGDDHDHSTHDHSHEGDDHDHSTHDHSHEGDDHDHSTHDHSHEGDDHDHSENPDEVVFDQAKAAAVGLKTKRIQPSAFTNVVKTSGRIMSAQGDERTLVATVPGVVSFNNTKFVEGSAVRQGQSVVSLVTTNLADGDIAVRTRVAYERAKNEYDRAKELVKDRIVSEREFAQITSDYETARVAYEAIGGGQDGKGVSVLSPINGYLKNLQVKEGDYVEVGQALATISQNSRLVLRAEVSEKYYGSLPLIHSANFKTPYDNKLYKLSELNGRLLSYSKSSEDNLFYVPVTFEFDNKGAIISGAYVEIYLMTSPIPNTLSVPVTSLIEEQGIYSVFIQLDETCYKKQPVALGQNNGAEVQVLSGLHAGDIVVTEAAYHLKLAGASNAMPAHTHNH